MNSVGVNWASTQVKPVMQTYWAPYSRLRPAYYFECTCLPWLTCCWKTAARGQVWVWTSSASPYSVPCSCQSGARTPATPSTVGKVGWCWNRFRTRSSSCSSPTRTLLCLLAQTACGRRGCQLLTCRSWPLSLPSISRGSICFCFRFWTTNWILGFVTPRCQSLT